MKSDKVCKVCKKIVPKKEDWEDLYLILTLKESKNPQWVKTLSNSFFLRNFCYHSEHEKLQGEDP